MLLEASEKAMANGESVAVITYGMGVYWAMAAAKKFPGQIEIIDLRCLFPLDEELLFESVRRHGKCLIVTEEPQNNSFAEALAGRISKTCFQHLDAAVDVIGAMNVPAMPMNIILENEVLPNAVKVEERLRNLLSR